MTSDEKLVVAGGTVRVCRVDGQVVKVANG
jgi:hypothetical protein